jgi:hypothetical protein
MVVGEHYKQSRRLQRDLACPLLACDAKLPRPAARPLPPTWTSPPTWRVTWRRVLIKSRVRSCVRGAERERSLEQETEATETKFGRERSRGSISDEYSSRKAC